MGAATSTTKKIPVRKRWVDDPTVATAGKKSTVHDAAPMNFVYAGPEPMRKTRRAVPMPAVDNKAPYVFTLADDDGAPTPTGRPPGATGEGVAAGKARDRNESVPFNYAWDMDDRAPVAPTSVRIVGAYQTSDEGIAGKPSDRPDSVPFHYAWDKDDRAPAAPTSVRIVDASRTSDGGGGGGGGGGAVYGKPSDRPESVPFHYAWGTDDRAPSAPTSVRIVGASRSSDDGIAGKPSDRPESVPFHYAWGTATARATPTSERGKSTEAPRPNFFAWQGEPGPVRTGRRMVRGPAETWVKGDGADEAPVVVHDAVPDPVDQTTTATTTATITTSTTGTTDGKAASNGVPRAARLLALVALAVAVVMVPSFTGPARQGGSHVMGGLAALIPSFTPLPLGLSLTQHTPLPSFTWRPESEAQRAHRHWRAFFASSSSATVRAKVRLSRPSLGHA